MDVSTFAPRIRDILQNSDLSTVSAKKVRRQLEHEMRVSLDAYKTDIDEIIKQQFQQIHNETQQRQAQQHQYAQQYAQQQGQMGAAYGVSQAMPGLHMPGGGLVGTGPHGAIGGVPGSVGGASGGPLPGEAPRKRGRPRKPENEKKQQRKKRVVDPNKPKRSTGLSKPMKLSQDLNSFLGQKYAARTEVVKSLWKYIKERELQDPIDKRYILCDDKLQVLFHESRLYMYTMNKLLNDHFIKPTPEENVEAIALLGLPPSHPAAGDGSDLPSSSVKAEGDAHSPAPSDGDTQHTGDEDEEDEEEEDDDDHDAKSEIQPTSASTVVDTQPNLSHKLSPTISAGTTAPLALPPIPSSINGAGTGASGV